MKFTDITETIIELIYPRHCIVCDDIIEFKTNKWFCPKCSGSLETINGRICEKCGVPVIANDICSDCCGKRLYFTRAYCAYVYKGEVRQAIHHIKFHDSPCSIKYFAETAAKYAGERGCTAADMVVPVPMHPKKLRIRGYNQSAMLAKEFSKLGFGSYENALVKIKDTKNQHDIVNRDERRKNLKDAFKAKNIVSGKKILLVDDIYTTGTTVNECAKALMDAGAESVEVICIAIVNKRE